MDAQISTIHNFVFAGIVTLFLFQSFILFFRSKNNKARRTMAVLELLWGLEYLMALTLMLTVIDSSEYCLLREKVLIIGNFYIMLTHFFPIQVLLPGWLNGKKITLLFLPIVALTVTYYLGMYLLGESPEALTSYRMVWDSIDHFNVWFRFVILLSNIIYIVVILMWLYKYEKKYIQWKNENFSDQEYVDISWMRSYDYIIVGISCFYMGILLFGGRLPVILHSTFAVGCFSYLFYKALFYENPYPEDFFAPQTQPAAEQMILAGNLADYPSGLVDVNEQTFSGKIPNYTMMIQEWLNKEKPYLFYDFRLTDVSRILPLNRTYLSRVFNEGFHQSFSEVVRTCRVDYSKEILRNDPSTPMCKVAEMSGFRSDTTYIKAFKQVTGMTPSQFKTQEQHQTTTV